MSRVLGAAAAVWSAVTRSSAPALSAHVCPGRAQTLGQCFGNPAAPGTCTLAGSARECLKEEAVPV